MSSFSVSICAIFLWFCWWGVFWSCWNQPPYVFGVINGLWWAFCVVKDLWLWIYSWIFIVISICSCCVTVPSAFSLVNYIISPTCWLASPLASSGTAIRSFQVTSSWCILSDYCFPSSTPLIPHRLPCSWWPSSVLPSWEYWWVWLLPPPRVISLSKRYSAYSAGNHWIFSVCAYPLRVCLRLLLIWTYIWIWPLFREPGTPAPIVRSATKIAIGLVAVFLPPEQPYPANRLLPPSASNSTQTKL